MRADVLNWGVWMGSTLPLAGMRLDAIKHFSESFLRTFIAHLDKSAGKDWFFVGEYWSSDIRVLGSHIKRFQGRMSLFDVQLVYNLSQLSRSRMGDLRTVFEGTLAKHYPQNAVVRTVRSCCPPNPRLLQLLELMDQNRHSCKTTTRKKRSHSKRPLSPGLYLLRTR